MAHTVKFNSKKTNTALVSYNIGRSVGSTGINLPVDVKLIQALLRMFYSEIGVTRPAVLANDEALIIDGIYGPITHRHLRAFKDGMRTNNIPTIADGKVDPFITPSSRTPHSKHSFVLNTMNNSCDLGAAKHGKPELFSDLPKRQDIPEDLRSALQTVAFEL